MSGVVGLVDCGVCCISGVVVLGLVDCVVGLCDWGDDDDVELLVCAVHANAASTVIARIVLFIYKPLLWTPWLQTVVMGWVKARLPYVLRNRELLARSSLLPQLTMRK